MEGKRKSVRIRQSLKDNFLVKQPKPAEKPLGKFSTSNPTEDFPSVSETDLSDARTILDPIEEHPRSVDYSRPNISSRILNTIFESNCRVAPRPPQAQSRTQTSLQIADDVAQQAVNDYVVERLKSRLRKSHANICSQPSTDLIGQLYSQFMEEFDLEEFCRQFKCLNTVKAIRIDKEYIIRAISLFFKKKRTAANQDLEFFPELQLKIELQRHCRHQIATIEKERTSLLERLSKIKEYSQKHRLNQNQRLVVAQQVRLFEQEVGQSGTRLMREHQKAKRLARELADTKEKLKLKIEGILQSGVYFESGYGHLYSQIVEAELAVSHRMLESLLDQEEIIFLKCRAELERKMASLQKRLTDRASNPELLQHEQMEVLHSEMRRLRNQLIILEEAMVQRIGRLPNKEKHVWSLFGTGSYGSRILSKLNRTDRLKNGVR